MRLVIVAAAVLTLAFGSGAGAHHKAGHGMPPGQLKKGTPSVHAQVPSGDYVQTIATDAGWRLFEDERYGFAIELPFGIFDTIERTARGLSLRDPETGAIIEVYGSDSPTGYDPQQFVDAIVEADRVREVTYSAGGQSWFVLSGFYSGAEAGDDVIFYTKFVFSADRSRLAAFEISFPARDKPQFAQVVERIEDSFTRRASW